MARSTDGQAVELSLAPAEAEAVWLYLNHYLPEDGEAFGGALERLYAAMKSAGLDPEAVYG